MIRGSELGRLLWPLSSLLSGVGLLIVGVGLLFSVVGLRAGLANFSGLTLGLVMSAYFAGFVLGMLYPLLPKGPAPLAYVTYSAPPAPNVAR